MNDWVGGELLRDLVPENQEVMPVEASIQPLKCKSATPLPCTLPGASRGGGWRKRYSRVRGFCAL